VAGNRKWRVSRDGDAYEHELTSHRIQRGKTFDWLQKATVVRYSRTMAAFLLFICHVGEEGDRYSVDFDAKHDLAKIVHELQDSVVLSADQKEPTQLMLTILERVIEYEGTLAESASSQYIVFHFLALFHLQDDGGFPAATAVTLACAHLQWGFRLVMYHKVRRMLASPHGRTETEMKTIRRVLEPMCAGTPTQMGTLLSIKGVLRYYAEAHPRPPLAR
jgi:hypothetical protein